MEKITAYRLTDGRIIEDEKRAIELQEKLDIIEKLEELIQASHYDVDANKIAETMYNLREEFIKALTNK